MGGFAWERVVSDIGLEVRDILALHLGGDGAHLSDETRLHEVEIVMSCEERFGVYIPNRKATSLATVGDAVRCVEAQVEEAKTTEPAPRSRSKRLSAALR